jgi:hypothetical protein
VSRNLSHAVRDTLYCVVSSSFHNIAHLYLGGQRNFYPKYRLNSLDRTLTNEPKKPPPILPQGYTQTCAVAPPVGPIAKTPRMPECYAANFTFYMSYPQARECECASAKRDLRTRAAVSVLSRKVTRGFACVGLC